MPWPNKKKRKDLSDNDESDDEPEIGSDFPEVEDFFGDFGKVQEMMNDMMKRAFSGEGMRFNFPEMKPGKPMVYGFSMKVGQNGKPKFEEFGNLEPGKKPTVKKEREPIVDVIEKTSIITILAELPGVEKKEIKLNVGPTKDILIIDVQNQFYKEVKLPAKVKSNATKAHYKNGVLEVNLDKQKATKPRKRTGNIKVE